MSDKKEKKGFRINWVDIIIILLIVAAVVFFAMRKTETKSAATGQKEVTVTYYANRIPRFSAEKIKSSFEAGQTQIMDDLGDTNLGVMTNVEVEEPIKFEQIGDSGEREITSEDLNSYYASIKITAKVNATVSPVGYITVNGNKYAVGHSLTLYAGSGKIYGQVFDIVYD